MSEAKAVEHLIDQIKECAPYVPFVGAFFAHDGDRKVPPGVITRLIELAMIAGFMYGIYTRDMEQLKQGLAEVKQQVAEIRRDFYPPRVSKQP